MKGTVLPAIARRLTPTDRLRQDLLREIALIEEGIRREGPLYSTLTMDIAHDFRHLTMRLLTAYWLLNHPETTPEVRDEIRRGMICRLRKFRKTHLTPQVIAA